MLRYDYYRHRRQKPEENLGDRPMAENQPESLITLQCKPVELMAVDIAVATYINLLETFPLPPESVLVIQVLRSFQQRCQDSLRITPTMQGKNISPDRLIPLRATVCELDAFATAVIAYIAYLRAAIGSPVIRSDVVAHLIRLQQRFIESQPLVPVND